MRNLIKERVQMKDTALVIMAAGIGSRFGGGIKQLEPVGPGGEIIMDYSIYDALQAGFNKVVFIIRRDLERNHPQIQIEDTPPFYDLSVFNRCAETGKALLTIACWQEVHPALISLPVEWDYCIPYGLLYSFDAPADVLRFVRAAEAAAEKLRTTST